MPNMQVNSIYHVQLSQLMSDPAPQTIITEVKKIFCYHYPSGSFGDIYKNFLLIKKLFEGKFPGYKACNTEYHNFTHTIDILLVTARLIDGYNIKNVPLPAQLAINLLNAALFHDTGYIQEKSDDEGTGAKYTSIHVKRSIQFLNKHQAAFKIDPDQIMTMSNLILCTDLNVRFETITFSSPEEQLAGCILGTSDLLSQMSDREYLEKLLFLYYEFKEAGIEGFNIEFDIIKKTLGFYEFMKKRFSESYVNAYMYALYHFKKRFMVNQNLYIEAIERHIGYLRRIMDDDSTNFRHKLRRKTWVHTYPETKS
jgi:hypothetical protein